MTKHNDEMAPMALVKKGLLRSKAFWVVAGGVVIVLILAIAGNRAIKNIEQRIALLEHNQKAMVPQDDITSLRDAVSNLEKQLKALAEQQSQFSRAFGVLNQKNGLPEKLEQQLQAQQVELNTLKDSIEALKKSAAASMSDKSALAVAASTVVTAIPSAAAKIPQKHNSTPVKPAPAKAASRIALKVPFVLTGTERRGTATFAAVAPPGFSDLSQVTLTGVGESVADWQLVSTGAGQATFRVNGRLQTVSVQ